MRDDFTTEWIFSFVQKIERGVREVFPQDLHRWPLIKTFNSEAYKLPSEHIVCILRDKSSGLPVVPGVSEPFPYSDHPSLPPRIEEIELWQFYLRDKFGLREEDAAFIVPIKDSGQSVAKDYDLFSPEERLFWAEQLTYEILRCKANLEALDERHPRQPQSITLVASGTNARQYFNSADSSVNVIGAKASEVFDQLRQQLDHIEDEVKREEIAKTIDDMESAYGSEDFQSRYKEFMAVLADHVTVFAPFLPALSNLLD